MVIVQRAVFHSREAWYPRVSIAVRRHMVMATIEKENIPLELTYSFRRFVHYLHDGKRGGMQADMIL